MALKLPPALDADKPLVDASHRKAEGRTGIIVATTSRQPATTSTAKFDRITYQREYMRKWRLRKKAGKG